MFAKLGNNRLGCLLIAIWVSITFAACGGEEGGLNETAGGISLKADPEVLPADGASSSSITATIIDSGGNPAPMGSNVTFTTSLGHFLNGEQTHSVTIGNDTGVVSVVLIASKTVGYAEITCTCNGATQFIRIPIGTNTYPGETADISLSAFPNPIPAGETGTTITATLTDANGDAVDNGTNAIFRTTNGEFLNGRQTIDGETSSGQIIVLLTLESGTATVTCESNDVSNSILIQKQVVEE